MISIKERVRVESLIFNNMIDLSPGSIPIVVDNRPNEYSTCSEQSGAEFDALLDGIMA